MSFGEFYNGFAGIGDAIGAAQKRSALSELGDQLGAGDYDSAMRTAFKAGDVQTGLGILSLKQTDAQNKLGAAASQDMVGIGGRLGGSSGGPLPPLGNGPLAAQAPSPPGGPSDGSPKRFDTSQAGKVAYDTFVADGLQPHQAAGFLGNFAEESSLNPLAYNKQEDAIGFGQWRGPRAAALRQFASQAGGSAADPAIQARFALHEISTDPQYAGAWQQLQAARTPEEAAHAVVSWEKPGGWRPGDPTGVPSYSNRLGHASRLFTQYGGPANAADLPAPGARPTALAIEVGDPEPDMGFFIPPPPQSQTSAADPDRMAALAQLTGGGYRPGAQAPGASPAPVAQASPSSQASPGASPLDAGTLGRIQMSAKYHPDQSVAAVVSPDMLRANPGIFAGPDGQVLSSGQVAAKLAGAPPAQTAIGGEMLPEISVAGAPPLPPPRPAFPQGDGPVASRNVPPVGLGGTPITARAPTSVPSVPRAVGPAGYAPQGQAVPDYSNQNDAGVGAFLRTQGFGYDPSAGPPPAAPADASSSTPAQVARTGLPSASAPTPAPGVAASDPVQSAPPPAAPPPTAQPTAPTQAAAAPPTAPIAADRPVIVPGFEEDGPYTQASLAAKLRSPKADEEYPTPAQLAAVQARGGASSLGAATPAARTPDDPAVRLPGFADAWTRASAMAALARGEKAPNPDDVGQVQKQVAAQPAPPAPRSSGATNDPSTWKVPGDIPAGLTTYMGNARDAADIAKLRSYAYNPQVPAVVRDQAKDMLKELQAQGKGPEAVQEFVWARRNGMTTANSPVEYAKEKKTAEANAAAKDEGDKVREQYAARVEVADKLGLSEGSPVRQTYLATGKLPDEAKSAEMKATEQKMYAANVEKTNMLSSQIEMLQRARAINPQVYSGNYEPGAAQFIARNAPTGVANMIVDPNRVKATAEYNNLVGNATLSQGKELFGARVTNYDEKLLQDLKANPNMSPPERDVIIAEMIRHRQQLLVETAENTAQMKAGTFFRKGQQAAPPVGQAPVAGPAQPPLGSAQPQASQPQAPRGQPVEAPAAPRVTVPSAAVQALRSNPALAAQFDVKYGRGAAASALGGQ